MVLVKPPQAQSAEGQPTCPAEEEAPLEMSYPSSKLEIHPFRSKR